MAAWQIFLVAGAVIIFFCFAIIPSPPAIRLIIRLAFKNLTPKQKIHLSHLGKVQRMLANERMKKCPNTKKISRLFTELADAISECDEAGISSRRVFLIRFFSDF